MVLLPWPPPRTGDVVLLPPVLSMYWPAGYAPETPQSISSMSEGSFTKEDKQLSDELAQLEENRTAYELSELHRPVICQSFRNCASNSSDMNYRGFVPTTFLLDRGHRHLHGELTSLGNRKAHGCSNRALDLCNMVFLYFNAMIGGPQWSPFGPPLL